MSRIGKQLLNIPVKTEVNVLGNTVTVKGPNGTLKRDFKGDIAVIVEGDHVRVNPLNETKQTRSMWGTAASHIENMILGVNKPFEKQLILEGVGFKSEVSGKNLNLALGFSHPVKVSIPEGLIVKAEKNVVTVSGIDIEQVGYFTAHVRQLKKPEPYKGKGFRYRNEVIRRKEGKKSV
ncbi:MAG: 50S ribosomal protein L6 [bacterium]|nr:50S ribosomal protein L6 [bacterium]